MKSKFLVLTLLFVLILSLCVNAAPPDNEDVSIDIEEVTEVVFPSRVVMREKVIEPEVELDEEGNPIEVVEDDTDNEDSDTKEQVEPETIITFYDAITDEELFNIEDKEYQLFLEDLSVSIGEDVLNGLSSLTETTVTLDHIQLKVWGEFLNKYYNKTHLNFPLGDIVFKFGKHEFSMVNNDLSKDLVRNNIVPSMLKAIERYAQNYPVKRYSLQINNGCLLKDYVCDLNSLREVATVYPFDGVSEYSFINMGSYYGVSLSTDYVSILRGYIEGDKTGYDRPVRNGQYPGCVNVLSYITLLKNVDGNTLSDKKITDFEIYKNLAICLDTKELIDTTDMSTVKKQLYYSDYKLDPDILRLVPISNDVVILQPTYLECFDYAGIQRNFGRVLDISYFLETGDPCFTYTDANGNVTKIPLNRFIEMGNRVATTLGNAPFLVYYTDYVPYDLLINFAYNQTDMYFGSDTESRDAFVDIIRQDLLNQNRSYDFDNYMMSAGQKTDKQKQTAKLITTIIIAVVIIAVVATVVIIICVKKKKGNDIVTYNGNNDGLMFGNDDDDYSDDDVGGFELH